MTTVWRARRVGERILCGHRVDGRYDCQGEIARMHEGRRTPTVAESAVIDGQLVLAGEANGQAAFWLGEQ